MNASSYDFALKWLTSRSAPCTVEAPNNRFELTWLTEFANLERLSQAHPAIFMHQSELTTITLAQQEAGQTLIPR
jgi:hypothetical protein